jgi:hypothetical protein
MGFFQALEKGRFSLVSKQEQDASGKQSINSSSMQ